MNVQPSYRVVANSNDVTAAIADRLVSLRIVDQSGVESDRLDLTLADHDPAAPIAFPTTGAELEVWLGYDGAVDRMGLYVVDEVELRWPPNQVMVKARAAPQATSQAEPGEGGNTSSSAGAGGSKRQPLQGQKERSWESGTTIGEMVSVIAGEHGLEPAVSDALVNRALPQIDQDNESDMQMLTRIALQNEAVCKPGGGKLVFVERGRSRAPRSSGASSQQPESGDSTPAASPSLPTVALTPDMVTGGRMTLSERRKPGSVVARWRDMLEAITREVTAGAGGPIERLSEIFPDAPTATAAARSALGQGQRSGQTLSLTLPGNTRLMAEGRVSLSGFRTGADGEWLLTKVEHRIDSSGYTCRISSEQPDGVEGGD
ncbi:contractile injection system protein, VgrG/Pvc8 family [Kushneria sp. AK178]